MRKQRKKQGMIIVKLTTLLLQFECFFQYSLLQEICTFTNIEGNLKLKDWWKQLDFEELMKSIATFLLMGVSKSKGEPVNHLRSVDDGRPILNGTFACNIFKKFYA